MNLPGGKTFACRPYRRRSDRRAAGDGTAASHYDLGAFELEALRFSNQDMLLALTVSGKTPWVWGAMRHAWSLGGADCGCDAAARQ